MKKNIFEFRMSGEPHCWEGMIDLRELSIEKSDSQFEYVLLKMDGTNNKTRKREQIQFHMNRYTFEELVKAINNIIHEYERLKEDEKK